MLGRKSAAGILAAIMVVATTPGRAGVDEGRDMAERWCSECHIVSADQQTGTPAAPTFAEIARKRTVEEIEAFLRDPHPPMARLVLTRRELADLAAYIESRDE